MLVLLSLPSALSLQLSSAACCGKRMCPRTSVPVVATISIGCGDTSLIAAVKSAAMADKMLALIDKWTIEDDISKPYESDEAADACMVPMELKWLNDRICELEECPLDLPEAFESMWERVEFKGEGCVTVNALKEELLTLV